MDIVQKIKDEIGWKENIDIQWLSGEIMKLCDHIKTLDKRITELEDSLLSIENEKQLMSSVELYKESDK